MSSGVLGASLAAAGLVIGPVLGVAVDRTVERLGPAAEHRCVHCQRGQGRWSLVPVASWFQRCECGRHKGWRYPLVDLAVAAVFALLGLRFGLGWMLAPYLGLGAVLVVLSAIDLETHLLPNVIVWPAILTGLFAVLVVSGELDYPQGLYAALGGAAVFASFLGVAHLIYEPGMGRGDVKLALLLGLFVGWPQTEVLAAVRLVLYTALIALAGVGVAGLAWNLARRQRGAEIPFGPALAAAALAVIVATG